LSGGDEALKQTVLALALLTLVVICAGPEAHGAISVESVIPDGPADAGGLQAGDRIARFDGREIATMDDLQIITSAHKPGDRVPVTVEREGEMVDLSLTLGERPGGGVLIGVMLTISVDPAAEPTAGTVACLAWIDKTYRVDSMIKDLGLDLSDTYAEIRACVEHDTQRMTSDNAVKFCEPALDTADRR